MSGVDEIERTARLYDLWGHLRVAIEAKAKELGAAPAETAEALTIGAAIFSVLTTPPGADRRRHAQKAAMSFIASTAAAVELEEQREN